MLYQSTRSKTDSFTSYRALHEDRTPDGGLFVPFRLHIYDKTYIDGLKDKSIGDNIAAILNLFFGANLSGWDVDCLVGKNTVNITSMSRRIVLARTWNNPGNDFSYLVDALYAKLCGNDSHRATNWYKIAARIAVLFGITGEFQKLGIESYDIAAPSEDFELISAAYYGKRMGLPIETIVCACNENSLCWDLLHRGSMDTSAAIVPSVIPELDVQIPVNLERLIFESLGVPEVIRYVDNVTDGWLYTLDPPQLQMLNKDIFVCVVGCDRVETVINNVYRSAGLLLDPCSAVAYGGLQDYRAKTGGNRFTMLISDRNPMKYSNLIMRATGLTRSDLKKYL